MFGQNQGSSGFSFGANNTSNTNNTNAFGGSGGSSTFGQSGSTFGAPNAGQQNQQQNQTQNSQQTSTFGAANTGNTLFGTNNGTANTSFGAKPGGSSLFGQSTPAPATSQGSGLFGSTTNANTTGGTGGGLFGNNSSVANGNAAKPSGLFGNNATGTSATSAASSGGLFGNNSSNTAGTGGLFGQSAGNTGGATGGLFGNSTGTNSTTNSNTGGGLFGNSGNTAGNTGTASTSGGLFRNSSNTGTASTGTGGLFGNSSNTGTASTGTGGLFGGTNTNNASTGTGGLFGKSATTPASTGTTGGLFGNSNANNATTGTGGLFGNSNSTSTGTNGLFGSSTATGTTGGLFGTQQQQQQPNATTGAPLIATINQAAYELPDVTPSVKLYTSLTSRPKETKQNQHGVQEKQVVAPPAQTLQKHPLESEPPKPEARKLMNSYKRFLEERPTSLQIKRSKLVVNPRALPPAKVEEPPRNFSIFHKVDKDVTTLTINKKALEQGYFIRPSLDDLLTLTKPQLKSVGGLIIGRTGYGQIEYPEDVDLSTISNLGDLLGGLVQFGEGTVCVYPDEDKKAKQGTELNKPAVVTIENVAPRDADGRVITNNSDPRVGKFVGELKKRCKSKGAEFITFTKGIWVFKVPHFSVWGITPQEMIMDDDIPEKILDNLEEDGANDVTMAGVPSVAPSVMPSVVPSAAATPSPEPAVENQILPLTLGEKTPDIAEDEDVDMEQAPNSWIALLKDNVLLAASSVPEMASTIEARNAVFAGSRPAPRIEAPTASTPTVEHRKFSDSDLLMSLDDLKARTTKTERADGLAKLETKISFRDLESVESANSAWSIAAMVFEPSQEAKQSLGVWIKHSTGPVPSNLGGLDLVWYLITTHSLAEAAARATALGNIRLSTMISCLGSNRENARQLLASLVKKGTIYDISPVERKILEVASGNLGTSPAQSDGQRSIPKLDILEGLDWKQRIGMNLWYGVHDRNISTSDLIKQSVKGAPHDNTELAMLKLVGNSKNLSALLSLVDEPTAFLLLQALPRNNETGVLADELYDQFAHSLLDGGRVSWSIFVALHIDNDEKALALCREILQQHPTHQFDDYLPSVLVSEAAAQHALSQGDYRSAASNLLDAGLCDKAHEIIITKVAPQAVIEQKLESVASLLDRSTQATGWAKGGKVYRDFLSFKEASSSGSTSSSGNTGTATSAGLAQSLSQSLRTLKLSSLEIKAAAALMSDYLTSHAGDYLTTMEVMGMPLSGDCVTVQACLRSYKDLCDRV